MGYTAGMADPTILIQLQRMGDLILTFPLMALLRALEPDRPLWVVAEPCFYEELMDFTPSGVVYMGPDMAGPLARTPAERLINLSHRPAALELAGSIPSPCRLGLFQRETLYSRGRWQLYRQSLVHNNRHNRFHWADLHLLDLSDPQGLDQAIWPAPRPVGSSGKVGLFVGASEVEKRPDPAFWGELARRLLMRGVNPVFLGGPGDKGMAHAALCASGLPGHNNLAGRFSLAGLAAFFSTLDLVISPDTGPMHLCVRAGVPLLNLSMGPVNAWETGPASPGHHLLRPARSCIGCWHCSGDTPCRRAFVPARIAALILGLLRHDPVERLRLPGLELCRTGRHDGLFTLLAADGSPRKDKARDLLDAFWQAWFLQALGIGMSSASPRKVTPQHAEAARLHRAEQLAHACLRLEEAPASFAPRPSGPRPNLRQLLARAASRLNTRLSQSLRHGGAPLPMTFWHEASPLIRPLSGYVHLVLQNGEYRRPAWEDALSLTARLADSLTLAANDGQPLPLSTLDGE